MLLLLLITFLFFYFFVFVSKMNKIFLYFFFPFILLFSILIFYILIGLFVSESVGISAISSQNYDAFDIFFENFSVFNSQVYRFLTYKIISIFMSIFGTILMLIIAFVLVKFINYFLNLNELHILYFLLYLIPFSYGFSVYFVSDFISYLIFLYIKEIILISQSLNLKFIHNEHNMYLNSIFLFHLNYFLYKLHTPLFQEYEISN